MVDISKEAKQINSERIQLDNHLMQFFKDISIGFPKIFRLVLAEGVYADVDKLVNGILYVHGYIRDTLNIETLETSQLERILIEILCNNYIVLEN